MTNRKLTPEKVQELLDKSTPGPWTLMEPGPLLIDGDGKTVLTRQNGDMLAAAPDLANALLAAWKERDEWRVTMVRGMGESTEMVRELADERDALRAEVERLQEVLEMLAKAAGSTFGAGAAAKIRAMSGVKP